MDYADLGVLERIADIIQIRKRQAATTAGLQMVHYDILEYLSRANRFSNSLMAASEWLGLTKGTVSQSIRLLEEKGYIESRADEADARRQLLFVTAQGQAVIAAADQAMHDLFDGIQVNGAYSRIVKAVMNDVLWQLQDRTGRKGFGACDTCRHYRPGAAESCNLRREAVAAEEQKKLCRIHEYAG